MHIDINLPTGLGALLVALFFAWLTSSMASSRRRDPLVWGVLGFFFPCLAIVVLLLIGKASR